MNIPTTAEPTDGPVAIAAPPAFMDAGWNRPSVYRTKIADDLNAPWVTAGMDAWVDPSRALIEVRLVKVVVAAQPPFFGIFVGKDTGGGVLVKVEAESCPRRFTPGAASMEAVVMFGNCDFDGD